MTFYLRPNKFEFNEKPSPRLIFLLILATGFLFVSSIPMVSLLIMGVKFFGELSGVCNNSGIDVLVYPRFAVLILLGLVLLMSLVILFLLRGFVNILSAYSRK
jgi:hypothetical protein